MPGRYLILHQPAAAAPHPAFERARHIVGLAATIDHPGLMLLCRAREPVLILPRDRGGVVGDVFRSGGEGACVRFAPSDIEMGALLGSGGSTLRDRAWGSYLSVVRHGADRLLVMRDPSGGIPCYVVRDGALTICSDDLRWVPHLLRRTPGIDRAAVRETLLFRDLRGRSTCLSGVEELVPGELTDVAGRRLQPLDRWHPLQHAHAGPTDMAAASELLQRRILSTVATLASGHSRPLVTVSGGLDSSVVAAGLVASGCRPVGLTLVHPGPEGDERLYTNALAAGLAMEIVEAETDADWIDPERSLAAWLPRPAARGFSQARERAAIEGVGARGCDSVFTGNGGDTLLGYSTSVLPVVDRYRASRSWRGTWRTIDDVAALHGETVWHVARRAWRARVGRTSSYPSDPSFLVGSAEMLAAISPPDHPWLDGLDRLPPAKAAQIRSLVGQHHHGEAMPVADLVPVFSPLIAQPVVEACLAVPTWLNVAGGRNRAVARHAFRHLLPATLIDRAGKGGPDGLCQQIYARHRTRLAALLLDGRLRAWGIVDGAAIEVALGDRTCFVDGRLVRLLQLADVEAWIRMRETEAAPTLMPVPSATAAA